jgi:hypothetical protein
MKKVVLVLATALTLLSCEKEVKKTVSNASKNQYCGLIVADYEEMYSITILYESGKYRTITLTPEEWKDANVGEEYCEEIITETGLIKK